MPLNFAQGAAPSAPLAGRVIIYAGDDGAIHALKPDTTDTALVGAQPELDLQNPVAAASVTTTVTLKLTSVSYTARAAAAASVVGLGNGAAVGDLVFARFYGVAGGGTITLKNASLLTTYAIFNGSGSTQLGLLVLSWNGATWDILAVSLNGAPANIVGSTITAFAGGGGAAPGTQYCCAADVNRVAGALALDATMQWTAVVGTNYDITGIIYLSNSSGMLGTTDGQIGLIGPTGMSVNFMWGGFVSGSLSIPSTLWGVGVDGLALAAGALNTIHDTSGGVVLLLQATVKGGSGSGAIGFAWNGVGGNMTVKAGSSIVVTPTS